MIKKIKKRDGRIVDFDKNKITEAIWKAVKSVGGKDKETVKKLTDEIVMFLEEKCKKEDIKIPTVEQVQDCVEKILIERGHAKTAKSYILYRQKRAELRRAKSLLDVEDDLKLPLNSLIVLSKRYLKKDENLKIIETPKQMFRRVAKAIASAEKLYGKNDEEISKLEEEFYEMMVNLEFLPNSPTLMNAGTELGMLSACFVLPVEDDMESIYDAIKAMAMVQKAGGGCIEKGSRVFTTHCGIEKVENLYKNLSLGRKIISLKQKEFVDVEDLNIKTPSFDKNTGEIKFEKIKKIWKYYVEREKTIKIRAVGGFEATVSEWHPFFVFDNGKVVEKRADELEKNDLIVLPNHDIINKWPYKNYQKVNGIELDEKLAWLTGLFLTDGSIDNFGATGLRLRIFNSNKKVIHKALDILEDLTGVRYTPQKDDRSKKTNYSISIYNQVLTKAMRKLNRGKIGRKDIHVRIPEKIFKSPLSVIGAFLAGVIDGEGHMQPNKRQIEYNSSSEEFAEDLSTLLYLFGIRSRYRRRDKRNEKWEETHEVVVSGYENIKKFADIIRGKLVIQKKKKRLEKYLQNKHSSTSCPLSFDQFESFLKEIDIKIRCRKFWRKMVLIGNKKFFLGRWREKDRVSRTKVLSLIEELLSSYKKDLSKASIKKLRMLKRVLPSLTKVKDIERDVEAKEFYDFTVENTNNYFAGKKGLAVIHNTGFDFSKLRPAGDIVRSTGGTASGPLSFMQAFNINTDVIKQGGCISSTTFIRTDKGVVPIGELLNCPPLRENFTNYLVYDGHLFNHAFIAADNGMAEVTRLKTDIGLEIDATYNHQVACVNENGNIEWRNVHKLKEGDWVVTILGGHRGVDCELPRIGKQHFNANPLKVLKKMTPNLAELLGLYMSDGCSSTNGRLIFSVENKDIEIIKKIERTVFDVFGLKVGSKEVDNNYTQIIFYSRDLQNYFKKLEWFKKSSSQAFVPKNIFTSPRKIAQSFLRGLFEGDGDVHTDGYPRLQSTSKTLVSQVQQLLLGLNIVSTYHSYKAQNSFGKLPKYHLNIIQSRSIKLFKNNIGFISKRKNTLLQNRFHKKVIEPSDVIPNQGKRLKSFYTYVGRGCGKGRSKRGANLQLYRAIYHYITDNQSYKRNLTRKRLLELMETFPVLGSDKHLKEMVDYRHYYTKIVSMERHKTNTMDIEVPFSSCFVANGILVHNKRRGANMGILRVDHPDILDFIVMKEREGILNNFNISVGLTDKFMKAVLNDKDIEMINPRNKKMVKKIKARAIWNLILTMAWRNGEPGIIFLDNINKSNPTPKIGRIEATNPCGEQPLLPYESCNLGSINLSKMVTDGKIDWDKLRKVVRKSTRFLDNVIDVNKFPIKEIEKMTKANRKIGLGVMGFANMLIKLGIPYNSEEALKTAEKVMKFITEEARKMSVELGKEKGSFPNFEKSIWKGKYNTMRNATVTTIAPTGTIGVIANQSSGIEPLFAISYVRNVSETIGSDLIEINPLFEKMAIKEGFYSEDLMKKISKKASIQHIEEVPERIRKIFVTAHDISPEWHIRMQAAFQKYVDNAVSKTVNFPYNATPQDIEKVYWLAYKLGCKGVTVYRDGSRKVQVLTTKESLQPKKSVVDLEIVAEPEYSGGCSTCSI